jgi:hypothetical protein
LLARDGGVVALVGGGQDVVVFFAVVVDSLDVFGLVVGQAEAGEVALFVDFVDAGEGGGERDGGVGRVDVEYIDLRWGRGEFVTLRPGRWVQRV